MKFRSSLDKYRRGKPAAIGNKAQTHTVVVETLNNEGDGVARIDGQAVFIAHTAPGDTVLIEITEKRRRWSRAKVVKIIDASSQRVDPICPYVQQCGGCTWQHIDYHTQLSIKQQQLMETLQRIGGLSDILALDIVPSAEPFQYRNRIRGVAKDGAFHFHGTRSEELVAVEQCAIASPIINQYLCSPDTPFANSQESIELAVMGDDSVSAFKIQSDRGTELGFRQVNDSVAERLNETVSTIIKNSLASTPKASKDATNESTKDTLLDLYCGHGNWTCRIAAQHPLLRVVGVDVSEHNVKTARSLAAHIKNASFIKNKAEKVLVQPDINPNTVIVDPPRAGLSDTVIEALNANPVSLLIYISCHPATLARDLAKLHQGAYNVQSVQAFDMFPQTPHVETLVVLKHC